MTEERSDTARPLEGQRVLVTGGARGIGAAISTALARAGADLVVSGRDGAALDRFATDLSDAHGGRVASVVADLSVPDEVERLAAEAWEALGGLEVLVNNAGITNLARVVDLEHVAWDEVMAVNVRAPALLGSRIGRRMGDAGGGSIVNVSSLAALRALPEHAAYCTSKAALDMLTKVQALELGPLGVRANAVCPTVVMTDMGRQVWGEHEKAAPMLARIPAGRFVAPVEVADAVVFLASDASAMINGIELPIDGGFAVA